MGDEGERVFDDGQVVGDGFVESVEGGHRELAYSASVPQRDPSNIPTLWRTWPRADLASG